MPPGVILACVLCYFGFLLLIAWKTSRQADNQSYFLGNRQSPWYAVAFGLIGDSLSGVTFISVPGQVATSKFSYLQIVLGYVVGYFVIAEVLLPLYYRLNLISIYAYLRSRFGPWAQKSGAFFFIISRTLGAAARLYLAAVVIQAYIFEKWGIPFALTVTTIIVLMLAYTYKGGIKTLVWTDTFQSVFLLLGLGLSIVAISRSMGWGVSGTLAALRDSEHTRIFFWDWRAPNFFWKHFIGGAFTAIVMTGLDQNMMQKNLSCRTLGGAKKNIYAFTIALVAVNLAFVCLGAMLYSYATATGLPLPSTPDRLFPELALNHLGLFAAVVFMFGLTAATFSSADSVLTTLTTSFCIDFLNVESDPKITDARKTQLRHVTHIAFAFILLAAILAIKALNSKAVIDLVLAMASYTYGPLLGLFAVGIFTQWRVRDRFIPAACVVSPILCQVLDRHSVSWLHGYKFGLELLVLNGLITVLGLWLLREPGPATRSSAPSTA